MILINKMGQASPNVRLVAKLFKHAKMSIFSRIRNVAAAAYDYSKQTKTNLLAFYFYNIIQIPVFIVMVLSIRKISYENEELYGAGALWFKHLNEPDPYLILPIVATVLNYFNLGVSIMTQ
jgi:membrane protein insertase Oxa1/YidC/SpoIIIJ